MNAAMKPAAPRILAINGGSSSVKFALFEAAAPMFGGKVDGQDWAGEYNLHRMVVNNQGTILRDEYRDTNNDGIKAINYLLWHHFGASG